MFLSGFGYRTFVKSFALQQGDQFDVMTIEGVETDNSLVVVHCLRLSLNGTDSGAPEYLISTHSVSGLCLRYFMKLVDLNS